MPASTPLPRRLLAAFVLIVVAMWALIALVLHQSYRDTLQSARTARSNLARSLAEYQGSSVRAIDLALRYLRDDWLRDPAGFAAALERHEEYLKRERVIQVAVVDRNGWLAYSRLPQQERKDFSDRAYFQHQKTSGGDELYISAPLQGRVTRQAAIQFTRPIRDAKDEFAGVIIVAVPPPALETLYKEIASGPNDVITLARADGNILARTGGQGEEGSVPLAGTPGLAPDSPAAGEFRGVGAVDGVLRLFSYRKLDGYPLTVFVGQSVETVMAPYATDRAILISGGALATALLLAIMRLALSRREEREKADHVRRRLEAELIEGERRFLDERERIMLDLHDGCIQSIYAIGLNLENGRQVVEKDPAHAARTIAEAQANLNLVIQELRAFIGGEARKPYSEAEFVAEAERLVASHGAQGPAFSIELDKAAVRVLTADQATHVLRIAREAVSNVVRHARAATARVSLQLRDGAMRLEVEDDGVGIAPDATRGRGLGIHNIHARARKLGGEARVASAPGKGTCVAVDFPAPP
jgi:signal transduction histidine kinase